MISTGSNVQTHTHYTDTIQTINMSLQTTKYSRTGNSVSRFHAVLNLWEKGKMYIPLFSTSISQHKPT